MGVKPLPFLIIMPSPQFPPTTHPLLFLSVVTSSARPVVFRLFVWFFVRFCIHPICVWAGLVSPGVVCISQQQAPSFQRQQPGQSESPPPYTHLPPWFDHLLFQFHFFFCLISFFLVRRSSGKQTVNSLTGHQGLRAAKGH